MRVYVYLVFKYRPKYHYGGFIHEGHYEACPLVFWTLKEARTFCKSYKHATFIRKVVVR